MSRANSKGALKSEDAGEEGEAVDGKLSIFIHKREDQSSHEVLQPLLRSDNPSSLSCCFTSVSFVAFCLIRFPLTEIQQLRRTSLSSWHWGEHGKSGQNG